jgi:hypothetical protein
MKSYPLPFNLELSKKVQKSVNGLDKYCFRNACLGMLEIGNEDTRYIEGWVIGGGIFFPRTHAWLIHEKQIVDPTPNYNQNTQPIAYLEALSYTYSDIENRLFINDENPPFYDQNDWGYGNREFRNAYRLAYHIVGAGHICNNLQHQYPEEEAPSLKLIEEIQNFLEIEIK